MKSKGIKINGYRGTWHVIDFSTRNGKRYYLLEHDYYGDMTAALIVDVRMNVVLDDVWNGFDDLDEYLA